MKLLVVSLLIAVASADWRQPHRNEDCPIPNETYVTFLPGPECHQFYKCDNGWAFPFECTQEIHFNIELGVCDHNHDCRSVIPDE